MTEPSKERLEMFHKGILGIEELTPEENRQIVSQLLALLDKETLMDCGHQKWALVSASEGTGSCQLCELMGAKSTLAGLDELQGVIDRLAKNYLHLKEENEALKNLPVASVILERVYQRVLRQRKSVDEDTVKEGYFFGNEDALAIIKNEQEALAKLLAEMEKEA